MPLVDTLRIATMADLPELQRLGLVAGAQELEACNPAAPCRRYVLALDGPSGCLAAATIVVLEPPQAHLEAMAMDECSASPTLEARLIGVADALAQAFGCRSLDVRRRHAA